MAPIYTHRVTGNLPIPSNNNYEPQLVELPSEVSARYYRIRRYFRAYQTYMRKYRK